MREIHEPDGAFRRLEDWLRGHGSFASGGEPCQLPLGACVIRTGNYDVKYDNEGLRRVEHVGGRRR